MVELELDLVFAHALIRKYYANGDTFVTREELNNFAKYLVDDLKSKMKVSCDVSDEAITEFLQKHDKKIEKFDIVKSDGTKSEGYYYKNEGNKERSYLFVAELEDDFGVISKMPEGMQSRLYDRYYGSEVFGISRPEELEIEPDIL